MAGIVKIYKHVVANQKEDDVVSVGPFKAYAISSEHIENLTPTIEKLYKKNKIVFEDGGVLNLGLLYDRALRYDTETKSSVVTGVLLDHAIEKANDYNMTVPKMYQ